MSAVRVRVPASTANLGPGFDVLAAALELHVEVEVERTGRFAVETDLAIAPDRRNLCVRAFARAGLDPAHHTFRIRSDVPLSGGLGTSAAARVAGALAARELGASVDPEALAAAEEGHPDNVAAAIHGGFVVCAGDAVARIPPPPGLESLLVVPREAVRTKKARAALPAQVPLADAVYNVGQASALVLGLERGDLELVARGLGDRLHQPHRAHLYPRTAGLVAAAPALGALGATVSGAGPSVLLWCAADALDGVEERARERAAGWADVLRVPFSALGAEVLEARR